MKWNSCFHILAIVLTAAVGCYTLGFVFNCFVLNNFEFRFDLRFLFHRNTFMYTGVFSAAALLTWLMYYYKHYWLKNTNRIIKGNRRDNDIKTNLENARFQTDDEIRKNFIHITFDELSKKSISGIPIRAVQKNSGYHADFTGPAHTLVIGTTGSGKTTTFINPTVQLLSKSAARSSMLITDPKGELYMLHAKSLEERGYTVNVLDLRNPFSSIKWNPLERPFLLYQRMLRIKDEATVDEGHGSYRFEGKEYYDINELEEALKVKQQQLYDLVYEDLHDIVTVLCPITNKQEPIWESGAKNFILAIALAMLEDSENPELGMTKERYNFYNLKAIATNTERECAELIRYFKGRKPTSRSLSLSKQVLDSAEKTRGSYISTMFDKLNLFADLSLCSLTADNELDFANMAENPTALFLQIPDERETRHVLAAMVILQAYKELVHKANTYPDLALSRSVYFLLEEFGNLPAVHKLEQMITVGRSRNIWLTLVVQSYAQLAKVYDDKVAEIIKSNCNVQIFIGSTDLKTIEDFSKRCGNYSVVTRNVGYNTVKADDINSNASIKERPLIYPSELQKLNAPGRYGNAIVTVFGYQPIRSIFTPSFQCHSFNLEKTRQRQIAGRYFDEEKIYYDMKKRNKLVVPVEQNPRRPGQIPIRQIDQYIEHMKEQAERSVGELLDDKEKIKLLTHFDNRNFEDVLRMINEAVHRATVTEQKELIDSLNKLKERLSEFIHELEIVKATQKNMERQMGGGRI